MCLGYQSGILSLEPWRITQRNFLNHPHAVIKNRWKKSARNCCASVFVITIDVYFISETAGAAITTAMRHNRSTKLFHHSYTTDHNTKTTSHCDTVAPVTDPWMKDVERLFTPRCCTGLSTAGHHHLELLCSVLVLLLLPCCDACKTGAALVVWYPFSYPYLY